MNQFDESILDFCRIMSPSWPPEAESGTLGGIQKYKESGASQHLGVFLLLKQVSLFIPSLRYQKHPSPQENVLHYQKPYINHIHPYPQCLPSTPTLATTQKSVKSFKDSHSKC